MLLNRFQLSVGVSAAAANRSLPRTTSSLAFGRRVIVAGCSQQPWQVRRDRPVPALSSAQVASPSVVDRNRLSLSRLHQSSEGLLSRASPSIVVLDMAPGVDAQNPVSDGQTKRILWSISDIQNDSSQKRRKKRRSCLAARIGCSPGSKRRRTEPPSCVHWFRPASTCRSIRSSICAMSSSASRRIRRGGSWS